MTGLLTTEVLQMLRIAGQIANAAAHDAAAVPHEVECRWLGVLIKPGFGLVESAFEAVLHQFAQLFTLNRSPGLRPAEQIIRQTTVVFIKGNIYGFIALCQWEAGVFWMGGECAI
jgi:hypothetical protein